MERASKFLATLFQVTVQIIIFQVDSTDYAKDHVGNTYCSKAMLSLRRLKWDVQPPVTNGLVNIEWAT